MIDARFTPLPKPIETARRRWRGAQDHSDRAWKHFRDARLDDLRACLDKPRANTNQGVSR